MSTPRKRPQRPVRYEVIFRRYRKVGGRVLDAHDYGYKAWPIKVKKRS